MKPAAVTAILVLALALLAWIRAGDDFDIRSILPLLGGNEINIYDLGGLLMLVIAGWGLARLMYGRGGEKPDEEEFDEPNADYGEQGDEDDE